MLIKCVICQIIKTNKNVGNKCCKDSKTALNVEIRHTVHYLRDLLIYINE